SQRCISSPTIVAVEIGWSPVLTRVRVTCTVTSLQLGHHLSAVRVKTRIDTAVSARANSTTTARLRPAIAVVLLMLQMLWSPLLCRSAPDRRTRGRGVAGGNLGTHGGNRGGAVSGRGAPA